MRTRVQIPIPTEKSGMMGHACNPRARARTQGITGHTVWSTWWASNLERDTVKKKRLIRKTFQSQPLVYWIHTYDLEHSLISSQHTHVNIYIHTNHKSTHIYTLTQKDTANIRRNGWYPGKPLKFDNSGYFVPQNISNHSRVYVFFQPFIWSLY